MQPHHVMPVTPTIRQLNIHLPKPHMGILMDRPLTEGPPPSVIIAHRTGHGHDVNAPAIASGPRAAKK